MLLTCQHSDIDAAIRIVNHAIASRPTLPVLSHVLLRAEGGMLRLSTTNLEMSINLAVPAEIREEGAITLPAKLFADFLHTLSGGAIDLSCPKSSTTMYITGHQSRASIKGTDASDFPSIPTIEESALPVTLDAAQFKALIGQTVFAAADDQGRPALSGVLLQVREDTLTLAAADSYRLAVTTAALTGEQEVAGDVLIPVKTLKELARILPDEGNVTMLNGNNLVVFQSGHLELVSRILAESFPPYEKMLPANYLTRALVDTKEFRAIVKSTLMFAQENANILKVHLGKTDLTIAATSDEVGDSTSCIVASVEGPALDISFNAKYVAEALAAIDTPEAALEVTSPGRPGVLRPTGAGAPQQLYLVMPLFIKDKEKAA